MLQLPFWGLKSNGPLILDSHNQDHLERVADEIVFKGGVVAFPVVYSYGLMTASTNVEGMAKIFLLKNRPLVDTLVIGGGNKTREQIVDWSRVPPIITQLGDQIFDLPHFLEMPIIDSLHPWIGRNHPQKGRIGVIFWANFYEPLSKLEEAVQRRSKNAFLVGSSANIHGQSTAETAKQVYEAFKNQDPYLSLILQDRQMENVRYPFHGTHTMIQFREGKFEIVRVGSISAGHFAKIYPQIVLDNKYHQKELERWEQDLKKGFHLEALRKKGSYLI